MRWVYEKIKRTFKTQKVYIQTFIYYSLCRRGFLQGFILNTSLHTSIYKNCHDQEQRATLIIFLTRKQKRNIKNLNSRKDFEFENWSTLWFYEKHAGYPQKCFISHSHCINNEIYSKTQIIIQININTNEPSNVDS